MTRLFKSAHPFIWAFVVAFAAAVFLYANHSTIAARGTKQVSENGMRHVPAVTGVDSSAPLEW
jgi:hypothetical protein